MKAKQTRNSFLIGFERDCGSEDQYPHGQRSPVDYSLWGGKELDMTEQLSTYDKGLARES